MPSREFSFFLALDTSFETGSVGLFQKEEEPSLAPQQKVKTLAFRKWSVQRQSNKKTPLSHSEKLIPEILSTLQEAKKDLSHLKFLAVNAGPGRFTGVRTAVNAARTLSFSLKIPCYPLNSLRIAAEGFLKSSPVITVAFNGFKNSVYFAEFSASGKELTAPCVLSFPKFLEQTKNKSLCVGDVPRFYDIPSSLKKSCKFKETELSVKNLAQIVIKEFHSQSLIPWFQLQPLYLREDIAKGKNRPPPI
ncbi:MAG: tRNA (adenosine(37)-N6)-threonylcarbamoyltransferase complex dimerization subunit type 1 TsaB [Bdellovibrionales bacterium]|nr:tRNA (adenosine(37)-N6)-threonylcarbamoyltransferase complex dimerization subunit type 1 TsaB [Bdellovibrionales bacterium]